MPKVNNKDGITPKTRAMKALLDNGFSIDECYQLISPDKPVSKRQKYQMQRKLENLSLVEPERVESAIIALDKVLKGQLVGKVKQVSTSDILAACRMVLDRSDPVVNVSKNLNVSVDLAPVDLSDYKNVDNSVDTE